MSTTEIPATDEQVTHLYIVARTQGDSVLMGLCNAVRSVGCYCDGMPVPCAGMGIHQARSYVSTILSGEAVDFTVRRTSPTTRRRISATQAKTLATLVAKSIEEARAKAATPRARALSAARAVSDAADAAWLASTIAMGGPGGEESAALEAAAIAAASRVSLAAKVRS